MKKRAHIHILLRVLLCMLCVSAKVLAGVNSMEIIPGHVYMIANYVSTGGYTNYVSYDGVILRYGDRADIVENSYWVAYSNTSGTWFESYSHPGVYLNGNTGKSTAISTGNGSMFTFSAGTQSGYVTLRTTWSSSGKNIGGWHGTFDGITGTMDKYGFGGWGSTGCFSASDKGQYSNWSTDWELTDVSAVAPTFLSPAPQDGVWAAGTKWYYVQIPLTGGYMSQGPSYMENGYMLKNVTTKPLDDYGLWCFVEGENGMVYIYNKGTGTDKVLTLPQISGSNNEQLYLANLNNTDPYPSRNTPCYWQQFQYVSTTRTVNGNSEAGYFFFRHYQGYLHRLVDVISTNYVVTNYRSGSSSSITPSTNIDDKFVLVPAVVNELVGQITVTNHDNRVALNHYVYDVTVSNVEGEITTGLSYQWLTEDGAIIPGATNRTYEATNLSSYRVQVSVTQIVDGEPVVGELEESRIYRSFDFYPYVVYLDVQNGSDTNDGVRPNTAVKTWVEAYRRMQPASKGYTYDDQVIVVIGNTDNIYHNQGDYPTFNTSVANKPVHITGKWYTDGEMLGANGEGMRDFNAVINRYYDGQTDATGFAINADHKLSYLTITDASSTYLVVYCHYHDLYIDKGVKMYQTPVGSVGTLGGVAGCITSGAHIFGGYFNNSSIKDVRSGGYVTADKQDRTDVNCKEEGFTITIRSGYWGVVSSAGRGERQYIVGTPEHPLKSKIVIDIDHIESNTAATAAVAVKNNRCNYDIGCVLAGNHAGTVYCDSEILIKEGDVSRVVNGILGNTYSSDGYDKGKPTNLPYDTYFGRAKVTVTPNGGDDSKVRITEFYGGGLGRKLSNYNCEVATNFYGKSIITINGGTFENAIYGAGAGGTTGVGALENWENGAPRVMPGGAPLHTADQLLPYWVPNANMPYGRDIYYGPDNANLVDITVKNFAEDGTRLPDETFNIRDTKTTITINGGKFGTRSKPVGIYAGGYGEVNSSLVRYASTPSRQAGCMFGMAEDSIVSELTINGGTIYGKIYGGGRGSRIYYDKYSSDVVNQGGFTADEYLYLGTMYGSTRLTIQGNAEIYGDVYGASQGVESKGATQEFLSIARMRGNIHLKINMAEGSAAIDGNVYGGGALGSVEGDIHLAVLQGTISGDVFGGGKGEDGHPDKAQVTGNIFVQVGQ